MLKEEEMLECPKCGAHAPSGSLSCPKCGVGFEEIPGPPPVEELPPPPIPPEPLPERLVPPSPLPIENVTQVPPSTASSSQGLVNGRGATNGRGMTNGRGAINGTGLVNGTGMVNGTRGETRQAKQKEKMFITRWQFLAVLIALVLVIPAFIYLSYTNDGRVFSVDGDFGEWSKSDKFGMYDQAASASIAVSEWSVETDGSRLFLYVCAEGTVMGPSDVSSYYLFIDSDGASSTGYLVSGIGADYMLQLDGWNGSVQSTALSEYGSVDDEYDWNSWDSGDSLSAIVEGNELEAMAQMPLTLSSSARFMLMTQNSLEQHSLSYAVPEKGGLLVVEIEAGTGVGLGGLIDISANVPMVRMYITAEGEGGTITSISPSIDGASLVSTIDDIELEAGDETTVDVFVNTLSADIGSLVIASVNSTGVESTFAGLQIIGGEVRAYVDSPPTDIQIDGAFADWSDKTAADSDSSPNGNIDIDAVGAVNGTSYSAFYVSVMGDMCGGSFIPVIKEKPSGGGGGNPAPPSRKTGEDILRIYIDSDVNSSTGQVVTLSSKIIGADHLLEISGVNGQIVSRSVKVYDAGQWTTNSSASIDAAKDRSQLELGVSSSSIGGVSSFDFIVETTDWRQRTDFATSVPLGAGSLVGGIPSGASILSWHIESPTASSSATAMSYQRKMFHDGTNHWSFYFDGTNTVYRYSTNGGLTWTLGGQAFSSTGVDEASLWYDSSNNSIYVVGDTAAATTTVNLRSGVVSPSTHSIAWDGPDVKPAVSTDAVGGKNTYISKDRAGYLWVMSSNRTQTTPTRHDLSVFVSTSPGSVLSWHHSRNMLPATVNQENIKGSIVNIGSGSNMLAVYGYLGNVASRTLTSSWSVETIIYAIGTANPGNTDNTPPSVVVDARGVAHVVYGNGHDQSGTSLPFIYYVYNRGAGWSVPYRLDSQKNNEGCFYPTISVDSATGNVFAFWVATSGHIGLVIQAKKNVSGTWVSFSGSSDTTSPKQYLTSIYSAPTESQMCWQWTQNTTGTIEVEFDGLPEFSDIVLPVVGMAAVFVFVYRRRGSRRDECSSED